MRRREFITLTQRWVGSIGLAAAVGLAYFLVAKFSVRLILEPSGVAVFWPAAGISSGILIALGPHARWPVLAGVMVATVATHLIINDPLWAGVALGLSNGAEALITAGSIHHSCRFQPCSGAPRCWPARGSSRRDDCVRDRGSGYLPVDARAIGIDARQLAALVRIRLCRNHRCCAASGWARCRCAAAVAAERSH